MHDIEQARRRLENITPLYKDCGFLCGQACCSSGDVEETGMLLFPGEDKYYKHSSWCKLKKSSAGTILICDGTCPRQERPLACRIFSLTPFIDEKSGLTTIIDIRSLPICPLARQGLLSLRKDFVQAVKLCMDTLFLCPLQSQHMYNISASLLDLEGFLNLLI